LRAAILIARRAATASSMCRYRRATASLDAAAEERSVADLRRLTKVSVS
jgi:hypothetical protein